MSAWFFDSFVRRRQAVLEAKSWLGTPFVHRAAVKGVGVDCVQLVGQVMVACGVREGYDFGDYPLTWGQHSDASLLVRWFEADGGFELLPASALPMTGDVAVFRFGRCINHAGIMLEGRGFIHAMFGRRVTLGRLSDPTWANRLEGFYRPRAL